MPLLEISNLQINHGSEPLVKGVHLSLEKGKTLCLVGESGSGKSLTSLAVMGLLPDTLSVDEKSEITFDTHAIHKMTEDELRPLRGAHISMIFQEPMTSLNPVLKVGDQVAEVLEVHTKLSRRERKARVLELFEKVKIDNPKQRYNAYPNQLSGGQRQRVMIAMALAMDIELLIADEPTTALDVTVQGEILKLIKDLQKEHDLAVLFVTHDFGVVKAIADDVAVMQRGEVVEFGSVEQVMKKPEHAYTKKLIAAQPTLNPKADIGENDSLLSATGLTKTFKVKKDGFFGKEEAFYALDDVSIQIEKGQIVGVVGESGSGKSTLARCLIKLYDVDAGSVTFEGQEVHNLKGTALKNMRRNMQMVFQDPFSSLNPRLSIGESIADGIRAHKLMPKAEIREYVEQLLADVDLPKDSYDRYPHQFSGGQRQRVCIARALALKPKLIIADEATSALDVSVQKQVLELMMNLKDKYDLSYLFISHDLRVVSQICDKVMVMQKGKVVEFEQTEKLYTSPQKEYTKKLLEAMPA